MNTEQLGILVAEWRQRAELAEKRLNWLHDCTNGSTDAEGFEWGIYRVKWENGKAVQVWQTNSDFSDLDAEMAREQGSDLPTAPKADEPCGKCGQIDPCFCPSDAIIKRLARRVMDAIIHGGLLSPLCAEDQSHNIVSVWSSGAEEQLEAIIGQFETDTKGVIADLCEWMSEVERWPSKELMKRIFLLEGTHMALVYDDTDGHVWHEYKDAVSLGYEIIEEVNAPQS